MDLIDKVVYINLESRPDRRTYIEKELECFGDKVIRFNAIKHEVGGIGCSSSHIRVLEMAKENKWINVLIVEDDMQWKNFDKGMNCLRSILQKEYDVVLLGGAYVKCLRNGRLLSAQTTTAYIVHNRFYDVLLDNYNTGLQQLIETSKYGQYALDQYWKQLQPKYKWFIVQPTLCIQRPDYSDIEKRMVDYRRFFA